jgi:hypothetical protein
MLDVDESGHVDIGRADVTRRLIQTTDRLHHKTGRGTRRHLAVALRRLCLQGPLREQRAELFFSESGAQQGTRIGRGISGPDDRCTGERVAPDFTRAVDKPIVPSTGASPVGSRAGKTGWKEKAIADACAS